jgi:multiple sugar transport system substrate-binding protein
MNAHLTTVVDSIRAKANRSRTKIGNVLGFVLVTVVIAGTVVVFTNRDGDRTLRIAIKQGVEGVALKEIASHFNDKGRADAGYVQVEVVEFPYDQLYEIEQQQLAGESSPNKRFDVIMVDDPWLYSLVLDPKDPNNRRLKNLTEVLKGKTDDYFRSTLRVCQYCPDHPDSCADYYAVPFVANSQLFAHRTDLPKEPTWQQVIDAANRIERNQRLGYVMRIGPGNSIVTDFMPILWAYDPKSFPEHLDGHVLNNPDTAFETLTRLVSRKSLGSAGMDDFDVSAYLQVSAGRQGGASMGIVWSAWAIMLAKLDDEVARESHQSGVNSKDNLQFGNVPSSPEPDTKASPELGAWLLAVPFNAEHKDAATAFIRFASDFAAVELAKPESGEPAAWRANPPPRRSVLNGLANEEPFTSHKSLKDAIEWSLDHARARPRTPCWKEIESRLGKNLEKLLAQDAGSTDAAISQIKNDLGGLMDVTGCGAFLQEQALRKNKKLDIKPGP